MKKIFTAAILMIILCCSTAVYANNDFTIKVDSKQAYAGDIVEINVSLENNPGVIAMLFDLTYDTEKLKLVNAEDMKLIEGKVFSENYSDFPYTMLWNSASANNFTQDGVLVRLLFQVVENAADGMADITLSYIPENFYNVNLEDVDITVINGGVKIISKNTSESTGKNNSSSTGKSTKSDKSSMLLYTPSAQANEHIILTIGKKEAVVFGQIKENDVAPIIVNDRTMLPIRFIAEALGAEVIWTESEPDTVIIKKDKIKIIITIGIDTAFVNSENVVLDSPAFIENERTYLPLRFVSENLGAKVEWIENTAQVIITK